MGSVTLKDKEFQHYISHSQVLASIDELAHKMVGDLEGKTPIFVCVLNGAFVFAAELTNRFDFPCEFSFVKLSTYDGDKSTGKVKRIMGLEESVAGRVVVVIEDIVDSGITIFNICQELETMSPSEIKVATLFFKPDCYKGEINIDYIGMEIPNDFIVGGGMDYHGLGRNLNDIYKLK
jgi:hypoxanthine phosphoribosyltransferase